VDTELAIAGKRHVERQLLAADQRHHRRFPARCRVSEVGANAGCFTDRMDAKSDYAMRVALVAGATREAGWRFQPRNQRAESSSGA
jgi:hypothetical protein